MFMISPFAQGSSPSERPIAGLRALFADMRIVAADARRRRAVARQIRHELGSLNDRELSDLGFGRGDIERVAREAAASA